MRLKANLFLAASTATLMAAAAPAFAQQAPSPAGEEGSQASGGEGIVVTGSRIARPELQSPMPVSVTNMEQAIDLGRISAFEALELDPALGTNQNLTSAVRGWDAGISAFNLRDLSTNLPLPLLSSPPPVSFSSPSSSSFSPL